MDGQDNSRHPRPSHPPHYQNVANLRANQPQNIGRARMPPPMGHCIPRMPSSNVLNVSMYPTCEGLGYHENGGIARGINQTFDSGASIEQQCVTCTCPENWHQWPTVLQEWPPTTRPETRSNNFSSRPDGSATCTQAGNRPLPPANNGSISIHLPPSNGTYRTLPSVLFPYDLLFLPPGPPPPYNMPSKQSPLLPPPNMPRLPEDANLTKSTSVPRWVKVPQHTNTGEPRPENYHLPTPGDSCADANRPAAGCIAPRFPNMSAQLHSQPYSNKQRPISGHVQSNSSTPCPVPTPSQTCSNKVNPIGGGGPDKRTWATELALHFDQNRSDEIVSGSVNVTRPKQPCVQSKSPCPAGYTPVRQIPNSHISSYLDHQGRNTCQDNLQGPTGQRSTQNNTLPNLDGNGIPMQQFCGGTSLRVAPAFTPENTRDSGLVISQVYSLASMPQGCGSQLGSLWENPSVWNCPMPGYFPEQQLLDAQTMIRQSGNRTIAATGQAPKKKRNKKETNQARDQAAPSGPKPTKSNVSSIATGQATCISDANLNGAAPPKSRIRWKSSGWECTCLAEPESKSRKRRKSDGAGLENMIGCKVHRKRRMELLAQDTDEHVSRLVDRLLDPEGGGGSTTEKGTEEEEEVLEKDIVGLAQTHLNSINLLRQKELESESSTQSPNPGRPGEAPSADDCVGVHSSCTCHLGPSSHVGHLKNSCPVLHQLLTKSSGTLTKPEGKAPKQGKKKHKKKKRNNGLGKVASGHSAETISAVLPVDLGPVLPQTSEESVYSSVMDSSMKLRLIKVGMELEKAIGAIKGSKLTATDKPALAGNPSVVSELSENGTVSSSSRNPDKNPGVDIWTDMTDNKIIALSDEGDVADVTSTIADCKLNNRLAEAASTNPDIKMVDEPAQNYNLSTKHHEETAIKTSVTSRPTCKNTPSGLAQVAGRKDNSKSRKSIATSNIFEALSKSIKSMDATGSLKTIPSTTANTSDNKPKTVGQHDVAARTPKATGTGSSDSIVRNRDGAGVSSISEAISRKPTTIFYVNKAEMRCNPARSSIDQCSTDGKKNILGHVGEAYVKLHDICTWRASFVDNTVSNPIGGRSTEKASAEAKYLASLRCGSTTDVKENVPTGILLENSVDHVGETGSIKVNTNGTSCGKVDGHALGADGDPDPLGISRTGILHGGHGGRADIVDEASRVASITSATMEERLKLAKTSLGLHVADAAIDMVDINQLPAFMSNQQEMVSHPIAGTNCRSECSTEVPELGNSEQLSDQGQAEIHVPLSNPQVELDEGDYGPIEGLDFSGANIPVLPASPLDGTVSSEVGACRCPHSNPVSCPSSGQDKTIASDSSELDTVDVEEEALAHILPSHPDLFSRKNRSRSVIPETIYLEKGPLDVCIQNFHGHKLPCLKLPAGSFFLTTQLRDEVFSVINRSRFHVARARDLMITPLKLGRSLVSDFNTTSRNKGINVKMKGGLPFLPHLLSVEDAERLYTYLFGLKKRRNSKRKNANLQAPEYKEISSPSTATVNAGTDLVCGVMLRYIVRHGVRLYPRLDLCCEMLAANRPVQVAMMKSLDTSLPNLDALTANVGEAQALNRLTNRRTIWLDISAGNCLVAQPILRPILRPLGAEQHHEDCVQPLVVDCNPDSHKSKPIQMLVKGGMTDVFGSDIRFVLTMRGKEYVLSDVCQAFGEDQVVCWIKERDLQIRQCRPNELQFLENLSGCSEFRSEVVSLITIPCLFELSRSVPSSSCCAVMDQQEHHSDGSGQSTHGAALTNTAALGQEEPLVSMERWGQDVDDCRRLAFRRMERNILRNSELDLVNRDIGTSDGHIETDYRIGPFVYDDDDIQMCVRPTETIACASDDVDPMASANTDGFALDFTDLPVDNERLDKDYQPLPVHHRQELHVHAAADSGTRIDSRGDSIQERNTQRFATEEILENSDLVNKCRSTIVMSHSVA